MSKETLESITEPQIRLFAGQLCELLKKRAELGQESTSENLDLPAQGAVGTIYAQCPVKLLIRLVDLSIVSRFTDLIESGNKGLGRRLIQEYDASKQSKE